jgi:hypothetical protein
MIRQWISMSDEPICLAAVKEYVARLSANGIPVAVGSEREIDPDWSAESGIWLLWGRKEQPRLLEQDSEDLLDDESSPNSDDDDAGIAECVHRTYGRTIKWLASQASAAEWWLAHERQIVSPPTRIVSGAGRGGPHR